MVTPDFSVDLAGVRLQNPLIPASGCFGFGEEFLDFYDPNLLGAAALKGTTKEARDGNQTPRIAEATAGMINSIGLQNPGIHTVLDQKLPHLATFYHQPVIMNLSGFSIEEYVYCARETDSRAEIIELNVSCPNVHGGGMSFGASAEAVARVTDAVRKVVKDSKLFVKLSPNVTDIVQIAKAARDAGADGLTLVNTMMGMRIDIEHRRPAIAAGAGGFSGPAIFPIAIRMIHAVTDALDIPVMGSGGVSTARDVIEMMMAGASAVQIGAQTLRDPLTIPKILDDLPAQMNKLGIAHLADIVGAARSPRSTVETQQKPPLQEGDR